MIHVKHFSGFDDGMSDIENIYQLFVLGELHVSRETKWTYNQTGFCQSSIDEHLILYFD